MRNNHCPSTLRIRRVGNEAVCQCDCGHTIIQSIDAKSFPQETLTEIVDHYGQIPLIARTLVTFKKPTIPFAVDTKVSLTA